MLFLYTLLPLLPLLPSTLAEPSPDAAIMKRDDCHGSLMCHGSTHDNSAALEAYNAPTNAKAIYHDYTSYTANHFTAIYSCPQGKYPTNVTGADIYEAGLLVSKKCGKKCGTHWLPDSEDKLKCHVSLNYCAHCKKFVNGKTGGDVSGTPTSISIPAGSHTPGALVIPASDPHPADTHS
ncbi:hypothetical protein MMC26_001542 [Xylographa opegraphella]|nr:hypothetical protein [Xylographa opegraphella]